MSSEPFFGDPPQRMFKRPAKTTRPTERRGTQATGRIMSILFGRGDGFIRLPNACKAYFHRADLEDGTTFLDLRVGDAVQFELFEDAVSGARALRVMRSKRAR
jgi:hypothetical protein